MTSFPKAQQPGLYHLAVGDILVTAINDGMFQADFDMIVGIDHAECNRIEQAAHRPVPPKMTMNAFLLQFGGRNILVDTGCSVSMGPTLGFLPANLAAMGVSPDDVDAVLVTHMHPDHINGLIDGDGNAIFPNAEVLINEKDLNFFRDPDSPSRSPAEKQEFFTGARAATAPYQNRIRSFREGAVLPGVEAVNHPGHTPGQTGYVIESNGDSVMIWGDIVHMPTLQMAAPHAGTVLDVDRELAVRTRRRALDMAATDGLHVAGTHFDFPAFGHIDRRGDGYAFVADVWRPLIM